MQEHFHFTTDQAKIQKQYAAIFFLFLLNCHRFKCICNVAIVIW